MITIQCLKSGQSEATSVTLEMVDRLIQDPDALFWIDLTDPTVDEFHRVTKHFAFHPLALEDAQKRHQRPKLDQYDHFFFLVYYAIRDASETPSLQTQEISFFIGKNYLVTMHNGSCAEIEETLKRWHENSPRLHEHGPAVLLYSILDGLTDNYFPILDSIAERIDDLEQSILDSGGSDALSNIFLLRRNLLAMRRILSPERDLMGEIARRDIELFGEESSIYFQDVYDHVLRVTEALDTYRDLLSGALDAHLSVTSNNLNQVMRTLTSWSIILMSVTLIAGIYGMNFRLFPSQNFRHGFSVAMVLMTIIGLGLFAWFKRIRWL